MIADDAELERQPAFRGIAERRGHTGIRYRNHDIGIDMALARQLAADPLPGVVDALSFDDAIGPGEVDVFEDAQPRPFLNKGLQALHTAGTDHDDLARLHVAHE